MRTTLRIMLSLAVLILLTIGIGFIQKAAGEEATHVGAAKCKLCHMKQHKIWAESGHAKAFEVLKPDQQKDPKCLDCHITGYRITKQAAPEMVGIQCEACHGPGSLYIKMHSKKDKEGAKKAGLIVKPDPKSCKSCHNPDSPTFKGFDYAKLWEQINHPK
ncbi:MAG: cytochrome c3 family protein [Nitrospirae bacterium]|nr:cytochrome c3 family protein [Nitrospirota bacterium]